MEPWFEYELPQELVAQEPLRNRVDARLMLVDRHRQAIDHAHVRDLPDILRRGDRLVLNDTKVIPAQLRGKRTETAGRWQGLFLGVDPHGDWLLVCKTRGRLRSPEAITLVDREGRPAAKLWLLEQLDDGEWRARLDEPHDPFALLERIGRVPLPPYIRGGAMVDSDVERLPNRVRPPPRRRRRAHGRAALHRRAAPLDRPRRRRFLRGDAPCGPGHLPTDRCRRSGRAPDARRGRRSLRRRGRGAQRRPGRRQPHRQRRHDRRPRPGDGGR